MIDIKDFFRIACMSAALCMPSPAFAKSETYGPPAVAAPNGKLGMALGNIDSDAGAVVSGSAAFPLDLHFGVQFDASLTAGEGPHRHGLGAHLFWRDPDRGLLGGTAQWGRFGGRDIFRAGLESEAYLGGVTLLGAAGWHNDGGDSTAYGKAGIRLYPHDNLALGLKAQAFSGVRGLGAMAEWKPENWMSSIFIKGGDTNQDGNAYALLGLSMSFGGANVSLKDWHRRYDPENIADEFNIGGLVKDDEDGIAGNNDDDDGGSAPPPPDDDEEEEDDRR